MSASDSGGVSNDQKGIGSIVPCLVGSTPWEEGRHVFRMETSANTFPAAQMPDLMTR